MTTTQNLPKETMHLNSVILYFMDRDMKATYHYFMDIKAAYLKDPKSETSVYTIDDKLHIDAEFINRHLSFDGRASKTLRELQCEVTTYMWAA
jgi:hypothetical protein